MFVPDVRTKKHAGFLVVFTGISEQWVLPLCLQDARASALKPVLSGCRFLRVFRVLKIVRLHGPTAPWFESFVGAVTTFNSLIVGAETDFSWHDRFFVEQVFSCIYAFEFSRRPG